MDPIEVLIYMMDLPEATSGELKRHIIETEGITHIRLEKKVKGAFTDILHALAADGRVVRRWSKGGYRYTITPKGKKSVEKAVG